MPSIITTTDLTKEFGDLKAVDHLSLSVDKGEVFGLLGPNGAGKTTTVGMLTTIVRPTSGSATVAGHSIIDAPGQVRRAIGIVFQELSLDTVLTGRENLEMSAQLYGVPRALRRKRIQELLELVNLTARADSLVRTYSGGMKRRLELVRGLLHHPAVLFLDEPTLGLDPQSREVIWKYIGEMSRAEATTIILTTHYMEEAEMMCDRIAIIDHGKVMKEGSPAALRASLGGDLVYLSGPSLDVTALSALSFVKEVKVDGERATVTVEKASQNLPALLERARNVDCVEVHSPTLNDVFLAYTGHQIREDEGSASWFDDAMRVRNQGQGR